MTYVEFYTQTSVENICALLTNIPDRVVIVGEDAEKIQKHIEYYEKVFNKRKYKTKFTAKIVSEWKIEKVVNILTQILDEYGNCVFGCTGGDEVSLVALGVLYERYRERNVQIHRMGIKDNKVYDCDNDGNTIERDVPMLSVEENIRIYGGAVIYGNITEDKTYRWDLTDDFCKDINTIWSICRGNPRAWNIQSRIFETIESSDGVKDGLKTTTSKVSINNFYATSRAKYDLKWWIINELLKEKLLVEFKDDNREVVVKYKNPQVKKILTKAGLALEMKIYLVAKQLEDAMGNKVYNDAINGVFIDWDGKEHAADSGVADTNNEIDVLLMHGMVPVFVSCKNGGVSKEELFKLNTVAEQFGGKYAKKILVASGLTDDNGGTKSILQRAEDMGITVLRNVKEKNEEELATEISKLWEN